MEIVWEYTDSPVTNFYTSVGSGAQRLPNGNTLVCEASTGRFFEVTTSGEMCWEYVVPFYYVNPRSTYGRTSMTFRCHRYGPDYPALQGKKLDPVLVDIFLGMVKKGQLDGDVEWHGHSQQNTV